MRRAKIVCTLGPATSGADRLCDLITAGLDVARMNMSHGDHAGHEANLKDLREASARTGRIITVFADLQGPKIRLGRFANGPVTLADGATFTITTETMLGDVHRASTTLKTLPQDVQAGERILIDDGRVELCVTEVTDTDVVTRVVVGGPVSDHKGINLPGVPVSVPALSDKDASDLRWALAHDVDMIALSFVRNADDILPVHAIMDEVGVRRPVIAKIEKPQALDHLSEIIDAFDAVMVARGDLGVELPFEDVPLAQKHIIDSARRWAKPVIVATQMLESMITAPRPTRAEVSDVANAVLDGADAVMLSGETSIGRYPGEAIEAMGRIIEAVEEDGFNEIAEIHWDPHTISGIVSWGAAQIAHQVGASHIIGFSTSGDTARRLARLRTKIPVLCFTPEERTVRELGVVWGLRSFISEVAYQLEPMIDDMDEQLVSNGICQPGEKVVVVYGIPMGITGKTNTVYVHEVGRND
ncbi:MAG: pyruvate kinase [Propionibacteriaceae bacterium]|jgi:pyruvate kinase|nr:pyruvate kinase [Propionibacteriaceae bacterium]